MDLGAVAALDIVGVDPVGRLLTKLRAHYLAVAGAALLGVTLFVVVLPNVYGLDMAPGAVFGVSYPTVVSWLIFIPIVWGFFAWQPKGIAGLLQRLAVRAPGGESSRAEIKRLATRYRYLRWVLLSEGFGIWEIYWFSSGKGSFLTVGLWWKNASGLWHPAAPHATVILVLHAAVILMAALTYYMVFMVAFRQCITVATLSSFFRTQQIEVLSLHPDQCGGFRFIGDYALTVAPLVAATGLNFSIVLERVIHKEYLGSATAPVTLPLVAAVYVSLSILSFVSPFWSAHRAMRAAKDEQLMPLAEGYQHAQERVDRETRGGSLDPKSVEQLETIRKARAIGDSIPTWPVHLSSVRNFSVALLSPLVPVAVEAVRRVVGFIPSS